MTPTLLEIIETGLVITFISLLAKHGWKHLGRIIQASDTKRRILIFGMCFIVGACWIYFRGVSILNGPSPKLAIYLNEKPLEGQRIPIKMEISGESPPAYHISLWQIEIREEGRKVGSDISTPLWRLSEKEVKCAGYCDDQDSEPSDSAQYPTVFRGRPFHVDVGGNWFIKQMTFIKRSHPPAEIRAELELRYGAPDPIRATFTMLPHE